MVNKIELLDRYFFEEVARNSNENEKKILSLISEINAEILSSYQVQEKNIALLLNLYERYSTHSISYLLYLQETLFKDLANINITKFDDSFIHTTIGEKEQLEIAKKALLQLGESGIKQVRLSSKIPLKLGEKESREIIYFLNSLLISEYLDRYREEIIASGVASVLPWLSTLYNITKNYSTEESPGIETCNIYIKLFESIVPEKSTRRTKDILNGSLPNLITHLTTSLVKLASTRYEIDFTTDNALARTISNQVIELAFAERNHVGYLLGMIVNADYSIVFKEKDLAPISTIKNENLEFDHFYYSPEVIKDFLAENSFDTFLWLGTDIHQVLPMLYFDKKFQFLDNSRCRISEIISWCNIHLNELPFENDKILINGSKAAKTKVDFENESKELAESLKFSGSISGKTNRILITKDYELSIFPHNLLLDDSSAFCASSTPIFNILSPEWLLNKSKLGQMCMNYKSSIWIPLETQDFVLSYLYSYIESTLKENNFLEQHTFLPSAPLSSDLNIIAAHGNEHINTFPMLYAKGTDRTFSITNLEKVIGPGKVLILFVCHSGSMRSDLLRNRVSTMVRDYLKSGYEAVIAPFWALDIGIVKIWLPKFLESFNSGNEIIQAVFDGNMAVKSEFPTPKAYACIHAYGNPYFKLGNK